MKAAESFGQVSGQITTIIEIVVRIALLLLIGAAVAHHYGVRVSIIPRVPAQELALLCAAWLAYRWRA
jgi:hypothetical protein